MTVFRPRTAAWHFLIRAVLAAGLFVRAALAGPAPAQSPATETIVLIRHGEKPPGGLGQLSCQGLNRALALGGVLARQFGKPGALFAPDPAVPKNDHGVAYDYVRPLATIEPAAIAFGLPVNASIGVSDIGALQAALERPELYGALVVVAWEHTQAAALARRLMAAHGADPAAVPGWDAQDFDGMDVIRIVRDGARSRATFERRREGLDGRSPACPP